MNYLRSFECKRLILEEKNENHRLKLIDMYIDELHQFQLADIIKIIEDIDVKKILINKYIDKLDNYTISLIINSEKNLDNKVALMEIGKEKLNSFELMIIIQSFKNVQDKITLIDRYKDKLNSFRLMGIIKSTENLQDKVILMDRYKDQLDSFDFVYGITSIKSTDDKVMLTEKYMDRINSTQLADIIKSIENKDKKIQLINLRIDRCENAFDNIIFIKKCGIDNVNDKNIIDKLSNKLYKYFSSDNPEIEKYRYCIEKCLNLDKYAIESLISYFNNNSFDGTIDDFNNSIDLIVRLSQSNSSEIRRLVPDIVSALINTDRYTQEIVINRMEQVFLKNNLPMMAKLYKVFDIMHPNVSNIKYESPNLNSKKSSNSKEIILFSDLMKITIGSNNRSLKEYVKNIEIGNELAKRILSQDIEFDKLDLDMKEILNIYVNHLNTIYNNTRYGKDNARKLTGDIKQDLLELKFLFGKNEKDFDINKLPDRIVRMFGHFAGINTIDELKFIMKKVISDADTRNRMRSRLDEFKIEKGDFIKGLANEDYPDEFYTFLTDIFQNGSVCKEFLGSSARSDSTPLDTDVSRILDNPMNFESVFTNYRYASSRYGPLWIVLKCDDRFNITTKENNKYDSSKLEIFETNMDGDGHYGIRTGFASSDIDYLVVDEEKIKLNRIKYEIVMNGFYIPVVNTKGKLIFTSNEYDCMRQNMAGLSYYGTEKEYKFAEELDNFDVNETGYNIDIESSIIEVRNKKLKLIKKLQETGLLIIERRSGDLSDKKIELLDIGSTGRGTNKMEKYDFDFVMRIDRETFLNESEMGQIYDKIKKVFPNIQFDGKNIRNQEVKIDETGEKIKLDITFIMKTDKLNYSTEECINDRLNNIKSLDPEKYKKILENIVLAKYILKDAYKPSHAGINPQGGLGGVGIENWILQNGGSFKKAARDFLEKAEGKTFNEFKKVYTVWDFGENNLSFRRSDNYMHDEFVSNNMNEIGYEKMKTILKEYINNYESNKIL